MAGRAETVSEWSRPPKFLLLYWPDLPDTALRFAEVSLEINVYSTLPIFHLFHILVIPKNLLNQNNFSII